MRFAILACAALCLGLTGCGDDDDGDVDASMDAALDAREDGANPDAQRDGANPDAQRDGSTDDASRDDAADGAREDAADAASDDASDGSLADASDSALDAGTPTTCEALAELDNGDECEGDAYCELSACEAVRCLFGVVARGNTCDPDGAACEDFHYETACSSDFDCAVAWYPDCCGGASARGIVSAQLEAFGAYAAECAPEPVCDCAPRYFIDEEEVDDPSRVVARCFAGQCIARVRGCASADECGDGEVCCYPCGIPGCENSCRAPCSGPGCSEGGCPLLP